MSRFHQRARVAAAVLGLGALYAAGLGIRQTVLRAQTDGAGAELPFTLESALQFRRVREIAETGTLREVDRDVFYPDGVRVRETYSVFSEYVEAGLAGCLPGDWTLTRRVRWVEVGWFCLGIPLLALWIWRLTGSAVGGAVAGVFYAVGLASVIRSTGQELSRENFALPLLIAHYAAAAGATRGATARAQWGWAVVSALALALALISWDLIQYPIGLGMVFTAGRLLRDRGDDPAERRVWCLGFAALALAGLINPYLRAHGFAAGPVMLLGWGILAAWFVRGPRRRWIRLACILLPLAVDALASSGFQQSYGHFGELLAAKIRFLNRKPLDPARLSFNQRVMWVPALHSANTRLTFTLFPAIVPLSLAGLPVLLRRSGRFPNAESLRLVGQAGVSLIAFWLFVRFHVFLAIYLSAGMGLLAAAAVCRRGWTRGLILAALALGAAVETDQVLEDPRQWGRSGVYYQELAELTDWLREHVRPEPVLANFGTSASILTYAGCPILLHPKFESKPIRDRFEAYTKELFTGTEASFRDFADREGAGYYVHGKGEFAPRAPVIYQMRYFAGVLDPPPSVPARRFEEGAEPLEFFRLVWENHKYKVYRIRTRADAFAADLLAREARRALEEGDLDAAETAALRCLVETPDHAEAREVLDWVIRRREARSSDEAE